MRQKLSNWIPGLRNFNFNFNGSYIISDEKYSEDELKLRTLGLREGETLGDSRPLQGQSPFLINAGIDYNHTEKGIRGGLYYNVQGKTLEVVGDGFYPDVYTMPFHSLNFNLIKQFENNTSLTLKVSNILEDSRESLFEGYGGSTEYFKLRHLGRTFSLGYSIKF